MATPIKFKKVRWKNFFSYGNNITEVDISQPELHLIVGASGAGKSTTLDAICFSLFGKPYKKVNKGSVINSINNKDCLVEIEFSLGDVNYLVRRGLKPNIFEIHRNGELVDKDAKAVDMQKKLETSILGNVNYNTFLQTSIVGTANFVPFMQLGTPARREVVEALLNLSIFSKAGELTKSRIKKAESERSELMSSVRATNAVILEKQNTVDMLLRQNEQQKQDRSQELLAEEAKVKELVGRQTAAMEKAKEIKAKINNKETDASPELIEELKSKGRTEAQSSRQLEEMVALWDKGKCPTCHQPLNKDDDSVFDYHAAVDKISETKRVLADLRSQVENASAEMKEIDGWKQQGKQIMDEFKSIGHQIEASQRIIDRIKQEIENTKEVDISSVESLLESKKQLQTENKTKEQELEDKDKEIAHLKVVVELFKDSGIKANIIKVFIPLLNETVNKFLAEFELDVYFEFDENFDETIKGRGRDDYTYNSLSEGEKRRVDLAILFSWLHVAELKSSVNMSILCCDEIMDSSLDFESVQNLVKIFQRLITESGKSIFVISHRQELKEAFFDSVLSVKKEGQFSDMVKEV